MEKNTVILAGNSLVMLGALRDSPNEITRISAKACLGEGDLWWPNAIPAIQLAFEGRLGGLMKAVIGGDLHAAWDQADALNRLALESVIPEAFR